jgi:methanogenic corrinoid protein MtbC1
MTTPTDLHEWVEPFLQRAIRSDGASAVRLVLDLLDQGASTEAVIVDLLAVAQKESGERWLKNEWTVADEHVVSGVTQRSLDAIANQLVPPAPAGSVVVACAEGDWHSLPAQMFAEVLRSHGLAVCFLGASTPSDHLARLLKRDRPDALIVTCNLALFFAGVTALVDAAHRTGTPVIAGGRALMSGPARARRLGADAWAPDVAATAARLGQWADDRPIPRPDPTPVDGVAVQLDLDSPLLAAAAFDSMIASHPPMRVFTTQQLTRTREDLISIVRFMAAARLVDDPTLLMEFLDWLNSLLAARGVPATALVAGLKALAPLVDNADPQAGELSRDAVRHVLAGGQVHASTPGNNPGASRQRR